jgi:uncharacterized protein (TIGR03083 family)
MGTRLSPEECVAALRREGGALAHAARGDPTRPVPFYPAWSIADLVAHTGAIHRWALGIVRSRAHERPRRQPVLERDPERLLAWFEEGLTALAGELADADPAAPVWSFGDDQTVGFWQARMAHETAIHRWDAESALGEPAPIECRLAVSGIPESLAIHVAGPVRGSAVGGQGEAVALHCDDAPDGWRVVLLPDDVRVEEGAGPGTASLAGPASDVWLFVTGRPAPSLRVAGDRRAVTHLRHVIRSVPGPTR